MLTISTKLAQHDRFRANDWNNFSELLIHRVNLFPSDEVLYCRQCIQICIQYVACALLSCGRYISVVKLKHDVVSRMFFARGNQCCENSLFTLPKKVPVRYSRKIM